MQTAPFGGKLETVEAARGLAALGVVLFHANAASYVFGNTTFAALAAGEHGVDFFFVLSGFIICFVHGPDIGQPDAARSYLMKRFIRLFPIMWIVVLLCIAAKAAIGEPLGLPTISASALLYPSEEQPYPLVLWTLRHELLFYLAFLVAIMNRWLGAALFTIWVAACVVQLVMVSLSHPIQGLGAFFVSTYQLQFVMGAALAMLHRREFKASYFPLVLGVLLVAVCFILERHFGFLRTGRGDYVSLPATYGKLALGIAFTLVLHGLLVAERMITVPRFMLLMGAASYAIYLVHTPLNAMSQHLAILLPDGISLAFMVSFGVAGGVALHLWVERPLARALRARLLHKRNPDEPGQGSVVQTS